MNEHTSTEAPREYGELYYSADDVRAILRVVAQLLEADQRAIVSDISSNLPSTMPWYGSSGNLQQPPCLITICRDVQLRLEYVSVLADHSIRLNALLRHGPINQRQTDREHASGVVSQS